jgi:hypothetical protein
MNCPICNGSTQIFVSEKSSDGVLRRRKCQENHRFNTLEAVFIDSFPRKKRVRVYIPAKVLPKKPKVGLLDRLILAGKI